MDPESRRREQLLAKYEQLKKKVKDWEQAVYKTEGRNPNREDMKLAPKEVQMSYREFVKIRKYLEEAAKAPVVKRSTVLTPGKIFLGSRRKQLQRTDQAYLTRTPVKTVQRRSSRDYERAKPGTPSLGLRSSRGSSVTAGTGSSAKKEPSSDGGKFTFKKLFKHSEEVEKDILKNSKKNHKIISVTESEGEVVERKVLIPNRFSVQNKSVFSKGDGDDTSKSVDISKNPFSKGGGNDTSESVGILRNPFSKSCGLDENFAICAGSELKISVDKFYNEENEVAAPKPALKSPIVKNKLRPSRVLDTGWLARIKAEEENTEEINENSTNLPAEIDSTFGSDPELSKSNIEEGGNLEGSGVPMDVDFNESILNTESNCVATITHDNSDSGICLTSNSLFNSEELQQAVQEVLDETQPNASLMSDADCSLLCSFNEDACLPSDPEFPTVDKQAISNLIQTLSDSINEDKEKEDSNPYWSNDNDSDSKKRPAAIAFSPSPEKPAPKRKFFKSGGCNRASRAKYSLTSFKPPSPQKKVKTKKIPQASVTPTTSTSKLVTAARNSVRLSIVNCDNAMSGDTSYDALPVAIALQDEKKSTNPTVPISSSNSNFGNGTIVVGSNGTETENVKPTTSKSMAVDIFNEAPDYVLKSVKKGRKRRPMTQGDKQGLLESKMSNGKANENYVRIDTKRKVFVRGHKKISVSKIKRNDWKNRKSAASKEPKMSTLTCNKCGEKGHFAKFCQKDTTVDECPAGAEQDDSPFPTLQEAARMVWTKGDSSKRINIYSNVSSSNTTSSQSQPLPSSEELAVENSEETTLDTIPHLIESVEPFFGCDKSYEVTTQEFEEDVIKEGLREFGYDSFRPGQQEAISRVLKGLTTLVILSTGSGKSLCYQLPAYLYGKKYPGALTLCISPLVSLMEDQIQGIPPFLNAACLHSNMTAKQKSIVLDKVKSKKLHILLVSPEAVCGGLFGILKGTGDTLPKISFACIDEVHCVSQWSHNFRPSYLQLCKILREKLNVKTILGLTATATTTTAQSICEHLNIDPSTTIRGELIPKNLKLSVSRDIHKDEALINLLRGERFCNCDSIIIYCTRRDECERIASFVRIQLQEISTHKIIKTKSRARLSGSCEAYHAGMTPRRRKNVQEGFMSGDIRIVVATVAFGMGIDKSDIRAVIHYNMPSAFESYVQEIGRAGRDGHPAHCHLFLDNAKQNDLCELKRHVYANSVDRPTIRRLLRKVFQSCKCKRIEELKGNSENISSSNEDKTCQGHEVSFPVEQTVLDLDLPQENITTLLCYLELDEKKWVEMLPMTYETCKIQSYGGAKLIKEAAARCPPLAVAIALLKEQKKLRETDTHLEFNVIETAATVGWNSSVVKKELKSLEWCGSQFDAKGNPTKFRKSGLLVEFSNLAYRLKSPGSLSDEDADEVLNSLHGRNVRQEQTQLYQLNRVYHALLSVSMPNINNLCDSYDEEKSNQLKTFIYEYFMEQNVNAPLETSTMEANMESDKIEDLRRSIRHLVQSCRDVKFTTRSVAKIFQGISSPCFPADVWYKNRDFWRRYMDLDFHLICRIAAEEL